MRSTALSLAVAALTGILGCYRFALGGDIAMTANLTGDPHPQNLAVNAGDTVTWILGYSLYPLVVESYYGDWKSPLLVTAGDSFSFTFTQAGFYPYKYNWYDSVSPPHLFFTRLRTITAVGSSNSPPAIFINSPIEGFVFIAEESIPIWVSVTNQPGTIDHVEFYLGTNRIGMAASPPFILEHREKSVGPKTLVAKAVDTQGGISVSPPVQIIIDPGPYPRFSSPRLLPNGVFLFNYSGTKVFQTYLQRSSDLVNWEGMQRIISAGTFFDELATNQPQSFYRSGL